MKFNSTEELQKGGFLGFTSIKELRSNISQIPKEGGVYLILRIQQYEPKFLKCGTGAVLSRDPNVDTKVLHEKYCVPDIIERPIVMYIGKVGGGKMNANLFTRISSYLKFGEGKRYTHFGGRFIWQLADAEELLVC